MFMLIQSRRKKVNIEQCALKIKPSSGYIIFFTLPLAPPPGFEHVLQFLF